MFRTPILLIGLAEVESFGPPVPVRPGWLTPVRAVSLKSDDATHIFGIAPIQVEIDSGGDPLCRNVLVGGIHLEVLFVIISDQIWNKDVAVNCLAQSCARAGETRAMTKIIAPINAKYFFILFLLSIDTPISQFSSSHRKNSLVSLLTPFLWEFRRPRGLNFFLLKYLS